LHEDHQFHHVDVFAEKNDMLCDEGFNPELDKMDRLIFDEIYPDSHTEEAENNENQSLSAVSIETD